MKFDIEHVAVRCREMDTSIDFYSKMFGAEIMFRRKMPEGKEITYLKIGDAILELMSMGPAAEPVDSRDHYGFHHFGIKVNDFETIYEDLRAKGAEFLGEPFSPTEGFRLLFLKDPNGTVIELASRDPNIMKKSMKKGIVNW